MSKPAPPLVVGVDASATPTRAVVAATDGTVLGRGESLAAVRSSAGDPTISMTTAVEAALRSAQVQPVAVLSGVVAVSGATTAGGPLATGAVKDAWSALGLPGCPTVVVDVVAVHAAGSPLPEGLVLIAGTGAVAAAVHHGTVVTRADGAGWLLGDEGGAVFLGLAAVRAAVRALDGRGRESTLLPAVLAGLDVPPADDDSETARRIIAAVDGVPPADLGRLAPLVTESALAGDRVAREIVEAAAAGLLESLDAVRQRAIDLAGQPPVIAGSVLLSPGPVADIVAAGIFARYGKPPTPAGDSAGGAAWIALRVVHGDHVSAAAHGRLTQSRT